MVLEEQAVEEAIQQSLQEDSQDGIFEPRFDIYLFICLFLHFIQVYINQCMETSIPHCNNIYFFLRSVEITMSKEEIIGVLKAHSERVIVPPTRPIYISRSALWTTAFWQFSRPSFIKKHGMLYVTFACD